MSADPKTPLLPRQKGRMHLRAWLLYEGPRLINAACDSVGRPPHPMAGEMRRMKSLGVLMTLLYGLVPPELTIDRDEQARIETYLGSVAADSDLMVDEAMLKAIARSVAEHVLQDA